MTTTTLGHDDIRSALGLAGQDSPSDHVARTSARALAAVAPALPPIKMPKLTRATLNSATVTQLLEAGREAAIVHTPRGVRVVPSLAALDLDDPSVVVLAEHDEVDLALAIEGATKLTVARALLDRELDAIDLAA